jgi:uncharacterized protein (DUF1697 family)
MRWVAMLRGINLGPARRVPMAQLRQTLTDAGYGEVQTYVQSGNVALDSSSKREELQRELAALIEQRFGFVVPVIARNRTELEAVVALNPLGDVVDNPKRYQVSFLSQELAPETVERLTELARAPERLAVHGREVYAWHPDGVARSKLWNALAGQDLGVTATARNWTTVCKLLEMAGG